MRRAWCFFLGVVLHGLDLGTQCVAAGLEFGMISAGTCLSGICSGSIASHMASMAREAPASTRTSATPRAPSAALGLELRMLGREEGVLSVADVRLASSLTGFPPFSSLQPREICDPF